MCYCYNGDSMEDKKENFLHKNLNLAFVYICIFIFGLVIVLTMINIFNTKLNEYGIESYNISE